MSIAVAIEQIQIADIDKRTRLNAYNLVHAVHQETGYICITKSDIADMFGCCWDRTRVHLSDMQAVNLIHYSTNSDGLVYLTFKAWTPASRVDDRKTSKKATKNDHPRAKNDHPGSVANSDTDHGRAKNDHPRAKNDHGRAVTYTRTNARSDRLIDSTSYSDPSNNQSITPGPIRTEPRRQTWEAPLSFKLLTDKRVAMRPTDAQRLSMAHSFHAIREAVAFWYQNRKAVKGRFEDYPGIVIFWLDYPEKTVVPSVDDQFRHGELWADYRTPEEVAEDNYTPPPPAAHARASPTDGPSPYLDDDPGWLALVGDGLADELAGLVDIGDVDGVPVYRFATKQPWINERNAVPLRKALTLIVRRPVLVEFVTPRMEGNEHGNT